jgi:general secretion pathway protein I
MLVPAPARRSGLSLLEVLVSLTIFLFSLIVIGQLITMAGDRALDVQEQTQAALLCETKLAEVATGILPMTAQPESEIDDAPGWSWALDVETTDSTMLQKVNVRVFKPRPDGSRVEVALSQMFIDPTQRGSLADTLTISGTTTSNATNSGTNSGTNTNSGTTQPSTGPTAPSTSPSGGTSKPTTQPSGGTGTPKTPTPTTTPTQPSGGSKQTGTGAATPISGTSSSTQPKR